jgi:hypothetical protein
MNATIARNHSEYFDRFIQKRIQAAVRCVIFKTNKIIEELKLELSEKNDKIETLSRQCHIIDSLKTELEEKALTIESLNSNLSKRNSFGNPANPPAKQHAISPVKQPAIPPPKQPSNPPSKQPENPQQDPPFKKPLNIPTKQPANPQKDAPEKKPVNQPLKQPVNPQNDLPAPPRPHWWPTQDVLKELQKKEDEAWEEDRRAGLWAPPKRTQTKPPQNKPQQTKPGQKATMKKRRKN